MDSNEKIIFKNSFGTVSDKRVILNDKKGSEEFPIKEISSVLFERRIPVWAMILIVETIILIAFLKMNEGGESMIYAILGLLFFLGVLLGTFYYIGSHKITLTVAGIDKKPIRVGVLKADKGRKFSDAIREAIDKDH